MSHFLQTIVVVFGLSCLVVADDEVRQMVQVSNTQHFDLPPGGTVRLKNSTGELTVQGWDEPGVEIRTVKSTKAVYAAPGREKVSHELDRVQIAVERSGDELVITTDFPTHRGLPPSSLLGSSTNFDLEYLVKVPRNTRLAVNHNAGEVHFDDVLGDIQATVLRGSITLHLPQEGRYAIDAKTDLGSVTSDFPGGTKRRFWLVGHQFIQASQAPHKLHLRDGVGDIIILKIRRPLTPAPMNQ